MKLINIGLDALTLNPESVVASRNRAYGEVVEQYSVLTPAKETVTIKLSHKTTVFGIGGRNKIVQLYKIYKKAAQLVQEGKGDVVTTQDTYFLGLVGVLLSKQFGCGLEVQVLGIEKLHFFRRLLLVFVLKRANAIRVISSRLKNRLISEFGIREDNMRLVPIYVDVSSLGFSSHNQTDVFIKEVTVQNEQFKKQYGDRFNIVSVNRLVPIKNISMQLKAVASLRKKFPNILLHIVGDGPLEASLRQEIIDEDLTTHVLLHGYKSGTQLSSFFTQSDCFVLTSDYEGYGMVVIEAATAGVPIVMTDVGCGGDVVRNEESALIVPVRDTVQFTKALERVITDVEVRKTLQNGGYRSVASLPSFSAILDMYKASWESTLEKRSN